MNVNDETKEWMTADYTRLSKEDGDKEESDSINNQKALIHHYAECHPELCLEIGRASCRERVSFAG